MDLINLLIRTVAFVASVWILLEFIFTCKVSTPSAILIVLGAVAVTVIVFVIAKQHKLTICQKCNSTYLPS
jgi:hypothetical protein